MTNSVGTKCPICNKEFIENDDVVVCPICGAPYHRHCYNEKGACIFDELHEKGEEWKNPEIKTNPQANAYEIKDKECPNCGILNSHSASVCSSCNTTLPESKDQPRQAVPPRPNPSVFTTGSNAFVFDPMGGVNLSEEVEENISFGEISKVVQQNTRYYLPVFRNIKNFGKGKFNFYSFFFSGPWMLYRKKYKLGTVITILQFALYISNLFLTMFVSSPVLVKLFDKAGIDIISDNVSNMQIFEIMQTADYSQLLMMSLPMIPLAINFIIMLIFGFIGNKLYLKHCLKTIKDTQKTAVNNEDYNTQIHEKGGVNTSIIVCVIVCYLICNYLPLYL